MLLVGVVAFCLGAATVIGVQEFHAGGVPTGWLDLSKDRSPIGFSDDAIQKSEIGFPSGIVIDGKARFLPAGNTPSAERLGYLLHVVVPHLDPGAVPDTSRRKLAKVEEVVYEGHFVFTLKDGDGFIVDRLASPQERLSSGEDNELQGVALDAEPDDQASRVRAIVVVLMLTRCISCE
jgi:hypothetical protein